MTMMNLRMREIVLRPEVSARMRKARLSLRLGRLADARAVEIDGCYFLEPMLPKGFRIDLLLAAHEDRTAAECSVSDLAVEDLLSARRRADWLEVLIQGILYACRLRANLRAYGHFKVILGFTSPGLTEASEFTSCTVRFHRFRPEEGDWLGDDLDTPWNAILVLDTLDPVEPSEDGWLCGATESNHVENAGGGTQSVAT